MTTTYPMLIINNAKLNARSQSRLMKQVGMCQKAGGRVELVFLRDTGGDIYVSGVLDWTPEPIDWKCVNGHDMCDRMYPGPECPYCEEVYANT